MSQSFKKLVVVGGGSAGWITASLLAASHNSKLHITLIESPDIPTVGVGEGTWPTMRSTLKRIGISETEFLTQCDASFKQGSRFDGWVTGAAHDSYLHPFAAPINIDSSHIYQAWKDCAPEKSFAEALSAQYAVSTQGLAPKQVNMPDYDFALNYAYHLDAIKLAKLLTTHATKNLGVKHIRDKVMGVVEDEDGYIQTVSTQAHGNIEGDFFLDCTGQASILLGKHFDIGLIDQSHILFNDKALTTHVPYANPDDAIASQTISTAHDNGWIWDIGLPTRRGVGCVYSSRHCSDDEAVATFETYLQKNSSIENISELNIRHLTFPTGYREKFWHKNCLAIGLSAGFIEPLEASALVLVELAAEFLSENIPEDRNTMRIIAQRFNQLFRYRWGRIIDFLKLHYVLSKRKQKYWLEHRASETIPERLQDLLALWQQQPPGRYDFMQIDEVFPAASYQYVLYGMGFEIISTSSLKAYNKAEIQKRMQMNEKRIRTFTAGLPSNRAFLEYQK